MYRKPNENQTSNKKDSCIDKTNHIGKKFSAIFKILMDPGYYEGTKYANYFNRLNEDGTSRIYVHDPLEEELDKFLNAKSSQMKYLVGLAGMGKTTLLRNYFKITNRDVSVKDNNITIYISFYNSNLSADSPQKSVEHEIVSFLSRTIKVMLEQNKELIQDEEDFWEGFYHFVDANKPNLLSGDTLTPGSGFLNELRQGMTYKRKLQVLDQLCSTKPIEYYCSFIKYICKRLGKVYHLILIYDDIEAKEEIFHDILVEVARHVHACFCANEEQARLVKSLVALRAYTYRAHIDRRADARRETLHNNTILKKGTVSLHDIFEARFHEIEEIEHTKENAQNKNSYKDAVRVLSYVEQQLESIGENLICDLTNYNLCNAMILYCSIMTDLKWIGCDEKEKKGSFRLDGNDYRLTRENIMYAIANGNAEGCIERNNGYIPNLLDNEQEGTDLVGLYIIRYFQNKDLGQVYGEKYAEGRDILSEIMGLFVGNTDSEARIDSWRYRVLCQLEYLYDSGVLLRSLYDIEVSEEKQIERKYSNTYKLYLSPRGQRLYSMLSESAVLLELYRDDIYTDLANNWIVTSRMSRKDLFTYLLDYLDVLFEHEKKNIANAISNLDKYQELIGKEFITVVLLEGVAKNLRSYFKEGGVYSEMMSRVCAIRDRMIKYADELKKRYRTVFTVSENLKNIRE